MIIRRATIDDLPSLTAIVRKNYDRQTAEHFVPEFELSFAPFAYRPYFYVAEADDKIMGCAGYGTNWTNWGGYALFWVNTHPAHQRLGIGKELVCACLRDIAHIGDTVLITTTVPHWYKKFGFLTLKSVKTDNAADEAAGKSTVLMILEIP
jgi:N-acetylglutamate synthase-like GNAT family acetyltransferase